MDSLPNVPAELVSPRQDLAQLVRDAAIEALEPDPDAEIAIENDLPTVIPELTADATPQEAFETLRGKPDFQTGELGAVETLVFFAGEITDRNVIDIGQALLIDVLKYLIAHQLLFPEETARPTLDDAVTAYIVPQFEHFMSELRRAETVDRDSDAAERFEQIIQLAKDLDLPRTAAILEDAAESKRVLS